MIAIDLTEDLKKNFQKDGFLILENFLESQFIPNLNENFPNSSQATLKLELSQMSGIGNRDETQKMLLVKFAMLGKLIIQLRIWFVMKF